jgi:hypothetical protein
MDNKLIGPPTQNQPASRAASTPTPGIGHRHSVPLDLPAILEGLQDQIDDLTATVEAQQARIDDLTSRLDRRGVR